MMGPNDLEFEKKRAEMYSECRQRDPFYWKAYQGSDQHVIQKFMVLGTKVDPFISGKRRDVESLKAFAEGCEEMELFPLAAHARWILVLLDGGHMDNHIKKFLNLLPKCGCADADFFRSQFKLKEDDPTKPSTTSE